MIAGAVRPRVGHLSLRRTRRWRSGCATRNNGGSRHRARILNQPESGVFMDSIEMIRPVLKSQYHASLEMLRDTIHRCPDALWTSGDYLNPFWRIAYHALYYTHFYLQPTADSFRP